MKRTPAVLSAIALALAIALGAAHPLTQAGSPSATLLLVSLDGWRWDYHTKAPVRHLRSLAARGVRAEALIPSFPTKTFPNHYTLVTGLYPGRHGVVGNAMRDPHTGRIFRMQNRREVSDPLWWGGTPIWNVVQRAGGRSAAMFWPGSEAPIEGVRPTYWKTYDEGLSNADRVDQVLAWLDLPPPERPRFITLYMSDVDSAGHRFGPDAPDLQRALERVDEMLGRLQRGLEQRRLIDSVNTIVVSDHGMAETSRQRVILVDDLFLPPDADVVEVNPTLAVWPRPGREEAVYRKLATAHPRLAVYRRSDTPAHWHYREHERVPPIVAVADEGWSVMRRASLSDAFSYGVRGVGGNHGYDPRIRTMHGLFVAAGPAFRGNTVVRPFENVDVFNVMCRVLGISPPSNDGNPQTAALLLR